MFGKGEKSSMTAEIPQQNTAADRQINTSYVSYVYNFSKYEQDY